MVRVGVVGAGGRMGQEVCRAVLGAEGLDLVAAVDPEMAGIDLRQVLGGEVPDLHVAGDADALVAAGTDVVVDFTVADAARRHLGRYADWGLHAVVGTTGLSESEVAEAGRRFAAAGRGLLVAANFAIGAALLMRFCELAAPFMDGAEVVELHHDGKRDAPSGTALQTAARIAAARAAAGGLPFDADATSEVLLEGARGGRSPGGVRVHSLRLRGLVAHEEVVFGADGQSLTLRHDSYDRRSFMAGVVLAVRHVGERPGLTVGLDLLLGF